MKRCLVFNKGKLFGDYPDWQRAHTLPQLYYVHWTTGDGGQCWYRVVNANAIPLNLSDVPKELQLSLLLMQ